MVMMMMTMKIMMMMTKAITVINKTPQCFLYDKTH